MNKLCFIVAAGDFSGTVLKIPAETYVIAADGGLLQLQKLGIAPNIIMGDFDSLGSVPEGENVLQHPTEKDDTDTMLAVKMALELGMETIVIFGGLGGRFDHSIANLQTLHYIANSGAVGFLVGCGSVCTVLKDGGIKFSDTMTGLVSVFSLMDRSDGVSLRGLKYEIENQSLTPDFPLGVSNEFIGETAEIRVEKGVLALMWSGNEYNPENFSFET